MAGGGADGVARNGGDACPEAGDWWNIRTRFVWVRDDGVGGTLRWTSGPPVRQCNTRKWKEQVEAYLGQARKTIEGRLRPDIPVWRYVCFYPMDKKRGEEKNWYQLVPRAVL